MAAPLVGALLTLCTTPAGAAPFGSVTTFSGWGDEPALAQVVAATLAPSGIAAIAGTSNEAASRAAARGEVLSTSDFKFMPSPPTAGRGSRITVTTAPHTP